MSVFLIAAPKGRSVVVVVVAVVVVVVVVVVVIVVVDVLTLTRIIKPVVTGQAPVTLELRNTPSKNTHNPRWYTHISQLTQFMPPPEAYKSEIGSQSTMCQVHAGAYVSLLTPGETNCIKVRYPVINSTDAEQYDMTEQRKQQQYYRLHRV